MTEPICKHCKSARFQHGPQGQCSPFDPDHMPIGAHTYEELVQFWFLTYVSKSKQMSALELESNCVLAGIHPLIWAAKPPDNYRDKFITYVRFYQEIDEETFNGITVLGYFEIGDARLES